METSLKGPNSSILAPEPVSKFNKRWTNISKLNIFCIYLTNMGNTDLELLISTGIMKLDDLKHVFKSSNLGPVDTRGYIVNLLNKFEVALTWDNRTLLIPSLLPAEDDVHTAAVKVKVRLMLY